MQKYDSSWDFFENEEGNMQANEEAFDRIYQKWQRRSWESWLKRKLTFPSLVKIMEDEDETDFMDISDDEPFTIGHEMKVLGIEGEDDQYGIIVKAREGRRIGYVPLCDLEVIDKENPNYWPVREYVVWFANQ